MRTDFPHRWLALVLAVGASCASGYGQLTVTSSTTDLLNQAVNVRASDRPFDLQAFQPAVDFVGDASHPAFVTAMTGDSLLFRFRLNEPESNRHAPGDFSDVVAVGIDVNGNGFADLAFGVTGKNGPGVREDQSFFARFAESRHDPFDLYHLDHAYGARDVTTAGPNSDFNYSLVSAIDGAVGDVNGSAGPNTLLTLAVSFTRLQDAVRALGGQYANVVVDATNALTFRFGGFSGTQTNVLNVDRISDGCVIPELPVWLYLAFAVAPLFVWPALRSTWSVVPAWRRRMLRPVRLPQPGGE